MNKIDLVNFTDQTFTEVLNSSNHKFDEGSINHCLINLREKCINEMIKDIIKEQDHPQKLSMEKPTLKFKDSLNSILPEIQIASLSYKNDFSALTLTIIAILGFFMGTAMGELLIFPFTANLTDYQGNFAHIFGLFTMFFFMYGAKNENIFHKIKNSIFPKKNSLVKSKIKNIFLRKILGKYFLWLILLFLIISDFLAGAKYFSLFLQAISEFIITGKAKSMVFNPYSIIIILICLFSLPKKIKYMDKDAAKNEVLTALFNWYEPCFNLAKEIYIKNSLTSKDIAKKLISITNILPMDKQDWYKNILSEMGLQIHNNKLKELGLPQNYETMPFIWKEEYSNFFDKYDLIKQGDNCFVDTCPIWENNNLVTRGLVRKVR